MFSSTFSSFFAELCIVFFSESLNVAKHVVEGGNYFLENVITHHLKMAANNVKDIRERSANVMIALAMCINQHINGTANGHALEVLNMKFLIVSMIKIRSFSTVIALIPGPMIHVLVIIINMFSSL